MRAKSRPLTSKIFIDAILRSHTRLTIDLLRLIKRRRFGRRLVISTGDPSHRFQVAALIVFLAGIEKCLSAALELLYLAGRVEWNFLKGRLEPLPGEVVCYPGFTAKLNKLESLGFRIDLPKSFVDVRNNYVHDCSLYAGYGIARAEHGSELQIGPHGPKIRFSGPPIVGGLKASDIKNFEKRFTRNLSRFLDQLGCARSLTKIEREIKRLPTNPEPEYSKFIGKLEDRTIEDCNELVFNLNKKYLGDGLELLLVPRRGSQ